MSTTSVAVMKPLTDRRAFECSVVKDWRSNGVQSTWEHLIKRSKNVNCLYQSPEWFGYLESVPAAGRPILLSLTGPAGSLLGAVPVIVDEQTLEFVIKTRVLWKSRLNSVEILGGEPLLPDDDEAYDAVLRAVDGVFPDCDCIWLPMVARNSFAWDYLNRSSLVRQKFLLYAPDGFSRTRLIELPSSFEEYLQSNFRGKVRQELRRQVRVLQKHHDGPLALRKYERPEDVSDFLERAEPVVHLSWQYARTSGRVENNAYWQAKLALLAELGVFRSYVLTVGETPCVYMLGYQYRDVYLAVEIGYDPAFSKFSPGTVAMFLRIQDLIDHRRPKLLSFGFGDAPYKQMFSNSYCGQAVVFLLRRSVLNRFRRASHAAFRGAVAFMKRRRSARRE
jgi:hypothetical protein